MSIFPHDQNVYISSQYMNGRFSACNDSNRATRHKEKKKSRTPSIHAIINLRSPTPSRGIAPQRLIRRSQTPKKLPRLFVHDAGTRTATPFRNIGAVTRTRHIGQSIAPDHPGTAVRNYSGITDPVVVVLPQTASDGIREDGLAGGTPPIDRAVGDASAAGVRAVGRSGTVRRAPAPRRRCG